MATTINNCLHCGSKAEIRRKFTDGGGYDDGHWSFSIHCTHCPINTGSLGSEVVAIRVWNRTTKGEPDGH